MQFEKNHIRIAMPFDQYFEFSLKVNNEDNNNRCVLCSREYTKHYKSSITLTCHNDTLQYYS